jgi:hypothetical protein
MGETNVGLEMGPGQMGVGLPGYEHLLQPIAANPTPQGVSTGRLMCGINTTALGAFYALQAGVPIGHVVWDPYAPIVGR